MKQAPLSQNRKRGAPLKAKMGLNFFTSVTGSFLYLVGSIMFIPGTNLLLSGEWSFIFGSAFVVIA